MDPLTRWAGNVLYIYASSYWRLARYITRSALGLVWFVVLDFPPKQGLENYRKYLDKLEQEFKP